MTPKTSDHILIVDDDREIRELLTTYLVKNGLRFAGNSAEHGGCVTVARLVRLAGSPLTDASLSCNGARSRATGWS